MVNNNTAHKYLTADIPGTGGTIKESPEDFHVAEIPLYLPCGDGEHVYAEIEKRGMTTLEAMRRIARELKVTERDMGYAGLKDAQALTRQTISIPRVEPERVLALQIPGISLLSALRHRNKLKPGHLLGNRFVIRVRGVASSAVASAEKVLAVLQQRGVPNYFGEQRYGGLGNSHLIGRALVRGNFQEAVEAMFVGADAVRDEGWKRALAAFQDKDFVEAEKNLPRHCNTERDLLQRLIREHDHKRAFGAVHPRLKKLYISAYQSSLFDRLMQLRLQQLDQILPGDLAIKHANGACFSVEDAAVEASRVASFEISASGPMFGWRMKLPQGKPLEMEEALLAEEEITLQSFNLPSGLAVEGERRALRVPLSDVEVSADPEGLVVKFALPKGAYATSVLREVMKA